MGRRTKSTRVKNWSRKKWLQFRYDNGLGGSDVATAMSAYNPELAETIHSSAIQLHLQKIGEDVPEFTGNRFTRAGNFLEGFIADLYTHWNHDIPDVEDCFKNKEEGIKYNRIRDTKSYLQNSRYPHLYASIDRLILGKNGGPPAILECKLTSFFEMDRYQGQLSPSFYLQVQTYLMMYEKCSHAEIALFYDSNNLQVFRIEPNKKHQQKIAEITGKFWLNILKCRQIKAEYLVENYFGVALESFTNRQLAGVELLQALEPEMSGSSRELQFVKDMIKPRPDEIEKEGSVEMFESAKKIIAINETNRKSAKEKDIEKARILVDLNGYTKAKFTKGYVSNKLDKFDKPRLYISPKIEF